MALLIEKFEEFKLRSGSCQVEIIENADKNCMVKAYLF